MSLTFHHFREQYGATGATERFEDFVVATVKSVHPSARPIRANPGDWSIDAYIGSLAAGEVAIWQAKFFLNEFGDSQKAQIRDSYRRAKEEATKNGYRVLKWTLCIPQDLDGPSQKWWDKWSGETHRDDAIDVDLWNLSEFRTLMRKPDAADVRLEYFSYLPPVHAPQAPPVEPIPGDANLDELLFARQLREAGLVETASAKQQFYNAELVERELADKGLKTRLRAFDGMRRGFHSIWEDRFNHHAAASDAADHRLPSLHPDVMERIDSEHDQAPREPFPLTRVHRKGALHQVVEKAEAGWTRDWRQIAESHRRA
jgi:hypothetical protein